MLNNSQDFAVNFLEVIFDYLNAFLSLGDILLKMFKYWLNSSSVIKIILMC